MNGDDERPPWERYGNPPPDAGPASNEPPPWDRYGPISPAVVARPTEAPTARITVRPQDVPEQPGDTTTPPGEVGTVEDTLKGGVGGLARGTAGLLGTGGTLGDLYRWGLAKSGVPADMLDKGAAVARALSGFSPLLMAMTGPNPADIQRAVEPYTGKFYEPKYKPGQYLSTLGEFAPAAALPIGGIGARVLNTVVPAITSETAGQFTKGQPIEPWARGAAALLSAPLAAKAVTPFRAATPARQQNVATVEAALGPAAVSAGQRTGSKPLGWAESVAEDMPFSSGAAVARREAAQTAQDRYITSQMFDPAEIARRVAPGAATTLPDAAVMAHGVQSLGDVYTNLAAANPLQHTPQLRQGMVNAINKYENLVLPGQRGTGSKDLDKRLNDITNDFIAGNGRISGEKYQATRGMLAEDARDATNSYQAKAFDEMKKALDDAMFRQLSPADKAAWQLNNQRYAVMKTLEPAVAKAQSGEHMSPAAVATALRAGSRRSQYVKAAGVMDRYAQAAADVFKTLPQSGTAPRAAYQSLFGLPAQMIGGAGVGAAVLGLPGAIAGAAIPFLPHAALRGVVSGPGQRYLGNRALPQNLRDILAQTILQQTIAQPSIVRRNEAELAAGRRAREQRTRALGLR